jgi:curved DNA-binding protein CbpA
MPVDDYYRVLELSPDASREEIRRRYREFARIFHPDMAGNQEQRAYFEEKFKKINQAYEILKDPQARARYDARYPGRSRTIEVSPGHLHFGTLTRGETASSTFIVDFKGTPDEINFNASATDTWFAIHNIASIAPPRTFPLEVEVVATTSSLRPGPKYEGWIEVKVDDHSEKVNLSLRVQSRPETPPARHPFRFRSGDAAHTPEALVPLCDAYWGEAKAYLYDDRHFKRWFIDLRRNDLVSVVEACQLTQNKDVGLDRFLRRLDPSLPLPKVSMRAVNAHLDGYDFSSEGGPQPAVRIANHGPGCCIGTASVPKGHWMGVSEREFAIPPRRALTLALRIYSSALIWESRHVAHVEVTAKSQNVPSRSFEFVLTTPRHPKIAEIEALRDAGKWRAALEELDTLSRHERIDPTVEALRETIRDVKSGFMVRIAALTLVAYGAAGTLVGLNGYFAAESIIELGVICAVAGATGALVYSLGWGGRRGAPADYLLGSLATLGVLASAFLAVGAVVILFVKVALAVLVHGGDSGDRSG